MAALRKVTEGLHSPAPQPEIHNRELDPGFEEDPDIFVVLAGECSTRQAMTAQKWPSP